MNIRNKDILFLLLAAVSVLFGKDRPASNVDVLGLAADSASAQCIRVCGLTEGDSLTVKTAVSSQTEQFVTNRIISALLNAGITVRVAADSTDADLTLTLAEAEVQYTSVTQEKRLGKRSVRRMAKVRISGQYVREGQVLWSGELKGEHQDAILFSEIRLVQRGSFLGSPGLPETKNFWRILEPIMVIGSLGVVVFLFYTIRSS